MGASQQFSLRWNNYLRHITSAFDTLRTDEDLVDVTLSCEGKKVRAHKMLLSACSSYFRELFKENPCQHPVIIFRNVRFDDLAALVDFMYQGEVNVAQEQLASFLTTAELLQVQGLTDGSKDPGDLSQRENDSETPVLPPEPEVHLGSQTTALESRTSSPRFFPSKAPDSPPSKRRKWQGGGGGDDNKEEIILDKEEDDDSSQMLPSPPTQQSDTSSSQPHQPPPVHHPPPSHHIEPAPRQHSPKIEILPVQMKVELPEYIETEHPFQDLHGDLHQQLSPLMHKQSEGKPEVPVFNTSGGSSDPHGSSVTMGMPSDGQHQPDLSQLMSKPGPSTEPPSQEALQGMVKTEWILQGHEVGHQAMTIAEFTASQLSPLEMQGSHSCEVCGKKFKHMSSVSMHRNLHRGNTECPVCHLVFSRVPNMKRHLVQVHGEVIDRNITALDNNIS